MEMTRHNILTLTLFYFLLDFLEDPLDTIQRFKVVVHEICSRNLNSC